VLLTQHNVHLLLTLMREMRAAILDGTFEGYAENFLLNYNSPQLSTASNL
jgi:tRNA-guanine family transglycosylase